jgi:hypothetical protein
MAYIQSGPVFWDPLATLPQQAKRIILLRKQQGAKTLSGHLVLSR